MLTHSIVGVPLLAAAATFLFRLRYKELSWKTIFGLSLLGMGLHIVFDLLNSYGVSLLYPLSDRRFEWSVMFIIDLTMWSLLLSPFLLSRIKSRWTGLEHLSRLSLAGVAIYILLCVGGEIRGERMLEKTAKENNLKPSFSYVFPEVFGPQRFRGVLKQGNEYTLYLLHVWKGIAEPRGVLLTDEDSSEVKSVRAIPLAQTLEWFYKAPVWKVAQASGGGKEVEVYDLRFRSFVLPPRLGPFFFRFKGP